MTDARTADRAFVLGLDGVPWSLIRRWTDEGELPNFARLREEGAAGPLRSTRPATTPVAWPSIATGVAPDEHGVYWFQQLTRDHSHRMTTSADVDAPELWRLLSPAVVGNVPMTYPAGDLDGDLVAGMMTPDLDDGFASSPALRRAVEERIPDYEVGLTWSEYADDEDAFLDALEELLSARRRLLHLLMEREDWRLFFFVFTAPDRLQHLVWDEDVLLDHYRTLDEILGEVMEYVDEREANLFVVSDHGFGPVDRRVAVNRVLERAGLLTAREGGTRGLLSRIDVTKEDVLSALGALGVDEETIVRLLPRRLVDGVATRIPGSHALYDVDFSRTRAFVHGPGAVYVNDDERFEDGVVAPGERAAVKAAARSAFESFSDPDTGRQVLTVHDGDELFPGDPRSPDLVLEAAEGYTKALALTDEVVAPAGPQAGDHRETGVLLARGPGVESGVEPDGASVVDVAPTVLHSVGEAVPAHADGTVRDEILAGPAAVEERAVADAVAEGEATAAPEGDFDEVTERLRGLGYMD